jgi:RNA polymerase sigma-70 factor (ECF subfamily)
LDEVAFRAVFDEAFDDIWRFARRRCSSTEDADDVTAETFAVAWRRRDDLPIDGSARLWLFGAARNVLANHHRGAGRRGRLHDRLAAQPAIEVRDPAESHTDDARRTWSALASLPDDDRELLLLRGWDELGVHEIAHLLGCTPNAASLRLRRARTRLQEALDHETDPGGSRTDGDRASDHRGGAT